MPQDVYKWDMRDVRGGAVTTVVRERCTRSLVPIAEKRLKSRSSRMELGLYTVGTVTRNTDHQEGSKWIFYEVMTILFALIILIESSVYPEWGSSFFSISSHLS